MKICHILSYFPPGWGGSETHNYTLVRHLLSRGYDVDVIVMKSPSPQKNTPGAPSLENINIHEYTVVPLKWIHDLRKRISQIEKREKIDIFDVHHIAFMPVFLTLGKKPLILSIHSYELNCPNPRGFDGGFLCNYIVSFQKCLRCSGIVRCLHWRLLKDYSVKRAQYVMVKYNYLKKKLIESNVPEEKIVTVPHWLDVERIHKISNSDSPHIEGIGRSDRVIIFFGSLSEGKGVVLLLRAFFEVQKKIANTKLVYIGDGPLYNRLMELAYDYGVQDKIIFLGSMARDSVIKHLYLADVILLPSPHDNYNWALLESMCTGKAIVATEVGGTTEILEDDYNALLASPDVTSLSSQMIKVLENSELAKKIGRNAFETVKKKHGLRNLKLYEELIKQTLLKL